MLLNNEAHWKERQRRLDARCKLCYQHLYELDAAKPSTALPEPVGPVERPQLSAIMYDLEGDEVHEFCRRDEVESKQYAHHDEHDAWLTTSNLLLDLERAVGSLMHSRRAGHSHAPGH